MTYQQYLDEERVKVPEHLRITRSPDLGEMRLDPSRYTSKEMHDLEVEYVWRRVWQLACREEDIPNVGDYTTYDVADISLIVVRTAESEIKAYFNSCLHRGRRLVEGSGCTSKFRCPYHAWTWNIDGSNAFVPCKDDFAHARDDEFQLPEARVECWQGFVFVNPDPNAGPLKDFLEVLPFHLDPYELSRCYKAIHVQKVVECNWKVALEAFMESYHVIATHPQLLSFMGDANAQYDILSDNVSRSITVNASPSPHYRKDITQQEVLEDTLRESGRVFSSSELKIPEGVSARRYLADMNREIFSKQFRRDFSQVTDSEVLDAILYWLFPNIEIWGGFLGNIVYVSRPHGDNPDECLFDIWVLQRVPDGEEKPAGVPVHKLDITQPFSAAEELGVLGKVFDQDMNNLPHMQKGLKTAARNGRGGLILGNYQEARIKQMHKMIDTWIERGKGAKASG